MELCSKDKLLMHRFYSRSLSCRRGHRSDLFDR